MNSQKLIKEFERQFRVLVEKNYSRLLGVTDEEFRKKVEPLKELLEGRVLNEPNMEAGSVPFVIVVSDKLLAVENQIEAVEWGGKKAIEKLYPLTPKDFHTIEEVEIPHTSCYLLIDIDRGKSTLNVRPKEALEKINEEGRSPLTIAEGIALITQYPELLVKNNCFSLLASRHEGDQRVPAIWISEKRPKLGWCWNGNPHTWLGSASCRERLGY